MTTMAIQSTILTPDFVRRLAAEPASGPRVSLYLSRHRPGVTGTPRTILRSMVQKAGQLLRERGLRGLEVEEFLRPLVDLAAQSEFEQGHTDGWAIFRTATGVHFVRANADWPEAVVVDDEFYLLPAIERLGARHEALLLAVTAKGVRLYRLRDGLLSSVALPPGVPASLDEDRLRNAAEHAAGRSGSVHFGVADVPDRAVRLYRDYFAEVARGLEPLFEHEALPVVLAGTREVVAAFRDACHDPHLLEENLTLSPDGGFPLAELEDRLTVLLNAAPREAEIRAADRIRHAGPRRWITEEHAAIAAAAIGQVGALFVAAGSEPEAAAFANRAATATLAHGGEVFVTPPGRMPVDAGLVAELRFSR